MFRGAVCSSSLALASPFRGANSSHKFHAAARGRPAFQSAVCSPLPASPCGSVPGSKFFTQIPRRRPVPAGFSKARFAPPSSRALAAPFRGANSSHKSRAAARGRPAFPGRGLLPPPREPLQLRSGEQILHINSAPTPGAARLFQGAVCSPLPANPCGFVSGSKFFTQIPRRRPGSPGFPWARFAPRCPLALVLPFRGANSSHKFRADARGRPAFPRRGLLPPPREPLQLRSGEQILHTDSAPTPGAARLFQGAVCSPLPANPCGSVPGSKFFTQIPRRKPVPGGPEHAPPRAGAQKAPCRFIGKVLPSPQQFPRRSQSRGALLIN